VSAFFLSGTQPSPLELDPSWHAALEYLTANHWQFGTQIVFTFGPLGFVATRTSLGHLLGLRMAFAFFWSAAVALAATQVARRLPGWVRYAFLTWLVVFTLSEGLDQTAFFVMAYGATVLLVDDPKQRWQAPIFGFAFIVLPLIKVSFLTAALGSLALVALCWVQQRKIVRVVVLASSAAAGFVACWMGLGQSPSHLPAWFRHGLELESGYSAAMGLVPKPWVVYAGLAALAVFGAALMAMMGRARRNLSSLAILITLVQYVFFAWKEGFTRSGDWHTFIFLWFLPFGLAFCFLADGSRALKPTDPWWSVVSSQLPNHPLTPSLTKEGRRFPSLLERGARWVGWLFSSTLFSRRLLIAAMQAFRRRVLEHLFAASLVLCLAAAHFQIPGFALKLAVGWPQRVGHNAEMIFATLRGHTADLYAPCRDSERALMLRLDRAKDVIGSESVDVMNYLALAAVVNGMNYRPRPIIQGFVAYTPALQMLNEEYFQSEGRPRFVMLCQQATDGRFPTLEDSAALNYVLNNYLPVARDGPFLILQQRTQEVPVFQLVQERILHFGEKLELTSWAHAPLFMSVSIKPSLLGRAITFLYQQRPLYMRVSRNGVQEQYRIVPSMAVRPFLLNPLLNSNYDVLNLYASDAGKEADSVVFERPQHGSFEFQDDFAVRLYTAPAFLGAAKGISALRMLADVQGRVFWPEPKSVESSAPAQVMIFHGSPALLVPAPSKIVVEIPPDASAFSGYFGVPEETYLGNGKTQAVDIAIDVCDKSGKCWRRLDRFLQPFLRAGDRGRFSFRVPINSSLDRSLVLATASSPAGSTQSSRAVWSQCRFEEK
jgi:hypothetical protein